METKHTPGPWVADISSAHHRAVVRNGMEPLAEMWMTGKPQAEREANARLTAAAPDLLEALREAVREMETCKCDGSDHAINAARAAISKAIGA